MGGTGVRWIQDNLILPEGDTFGEPFILRPDQRLYLYQWYEYCPSCQEWRYNEGVRGAATGDGKSTFIAAIALLEFAGPPGIAPKSPVVNVAADSWLKDHPGAWAACEGEWVPDPSNPFVLAVDMALKHDSVAVNRIEELSDGRFAVTAKVWKANKRGQIDHEAVWNHIIAEARGENFRGVVYDPRFFEVPARMLETRGILAIQFDQSPQRMAPACGLTYERILAGSIVHDGDQELTDAVTAAVQMPQERGGFTLRKNKSRRHIDACVAMCMGVWVLAEVPDLDEPPNLW